MSDRRGDPLAKRTRLQIVRLIPSATMNRAPDCCRHVLAFALIFSARISSHFHRVLAASLLFVFALSLRAEEWTLQPVEFDGTPIYLATPASFVAAPATDPRMLFTRKSLPPTNLLVAGFFPPDDSQRYCLVQQVTATRTWRYNAREWQQLRAQFGELVQGLSLKDISESMNKRVSEVLGEAAPGAELRLEKPVMLPVIDSSDYHLTAPMLLAINVSVGGTTKRQLVVAACTIYVLKGRMVHVFLYEPFVGKETYAIVAQKAREMALRTLKAN